MWAKGDLSAVKVQRLALTAMRQGMNGGLVERLSRAGSSGEHPQNVFRAMQTILGYPTGSPAMSWYTIPTRAGAQTPHPFLLPHAFFKAFYAARQNEWRDVFAGPVGACREFWGQMKDSTFVRQHPNLAPESWARTIPLGIHADAGAFSDHDSLYTVSWNSLLGRGSTQQKRFVFTVIRKAEMVPETLDAILRIFSWSINAVLCGEEPTNGPTGETMGGEPGPLANHWRGALCQVRGDWSFYCECFKFPQWNCADTMCWMCRASATDPTRLWSDFSETAGWRGTLWTHEAYLAHLIARGETVPVLLALVLGMRLECIMIDTLHSVDQGVTAHIVGNIFFILCCVRGVFGGNTYAERVRRMAADLKQWYSATRTKNKYRGKLTLERFRKQGQWPKLMGKAAAIKALCKYALHLAMTYNNGSRYDILMLEICQLMQEFYNLMDSESQFMADVARDQLPRIAQRLVEKYATLAADAFSRDMRLWKVSPKHHLFLHLCQIQAILYGNPRYYWCYPDEDLVGLAIDVAEGCHPGTMAYSMLFKWLHTRFMPMAVDESDPEW